LRAQAHDFAVQVIHPGRRRLTDVFGSAQAPGALGHRDPRARGPRPGCARTDRARRAAEARNELCPARAADVAEPRQRLVKHCAHPSTTRRSRRRAC
jgi:hypothetical protein